MRELCTICDIIDPWGVTMYAQVFVLGIIRFRHRLELQHNEQSLMHVHLHCCNLALVLQSSGKYSRVIRERARLVTLQSLIRI